MENCYAPSQWGIELHLDSLGANGISTIANLYEIKDKISIWLWVGDPDNGKRLLFVKKG